MFISRNLRVDSPFRQILEAAGWQVTGKSLIRFDPLAFSWPLPADWIFFSSRRAVEFFVNGLPPGQAELGAYRLACLGKGTADSLRAAGYRAEFVGDGRPEGTGRSFLAQANRCRVIFPRATRSRRSVQKILQEWVEVVDLPVYRNRPVNSPDLPASDLFVLTSPMNAEVLLQHYPGALQAPLVAIGPTTREKLDALGAKDVLQAVEPSEEGLAKVILDRFNGT